MAEQDSLAAFEFALRRYAAGKPFQAARYGFLAALDNLGHAILPGLSDICLKRPHTAASRMSAAPFSPIISAAALVFDEGMVGMIEASRSEEHTSELQSLMRISYAVFCLTKKIKQHRLTL